MNALADSAACAKREKPVLTVPRENHAVSESFVVFNRGELF
jgi:hypothetical protein